MDDLSELKAAMWGVKRNGHTEKGVVDRVEDLEERMDQFDDLVLRIDTSWKIIRFTLGAIGVGQFAALVKLFFHS